MNNFLQSTYNPFSAEREDKGTEKKIAPTKNFGENTDNNFSTSVFDLPEEKLAEMIKETQPKKNPEKP
ncbi:MAG: hypothetical protein A3I88_03955 [Candidatus Portnoybacteria bacterium RIFCSPLOWO2_12_FULL_39_9]|uniref:Uncharacterized protein n=1 Tax=Candidatus Portnoybacteria bacterium RIFCSPHIGHO2_12_FULL_38_9 TaxID=1801997 RepID=A0A1G2FFW7_9BACT|nr:MAG: hypothetical protein A2646_01980 [Candidatus Portnoybacteria bacterium RIFCSPHIGHO2_02_FULL_39_12]OGZ36451.1 MAG: hypothetical protein A3J64_02370 [Candidatus Portnoybacteria bacterium RIFCSPHIGHO2_12_FULL_38_9]OGZ38147.1 MAG: hypothetical protein A3F21_03845 [Candidatus Portnoybacteria bacterium RIFCSPLOWO2_01_FULL_38_39]OGZ40264.1 MAG: hypothetical protein A3I88_03955 [Candidatus Portnoybacteria bacterium RIFCSPLOWO2_12_FULL_39_9]